MLLRVRVRREEDGDGNLELPFKDMQQVQDLLKVLAGAEVEDLLVEVRFGSSMADVNGRIDEEKEIKSIKKSAKYTYG